MAEFYAVDKSTAKSANHTCEFGGEFATDFQWILPFALQKVQRICARGKTGFLYIIFASEKSMIYPQQKHARIFILD